MAAWRVMRGVWRHPSLVTRHSSRATRHASPVGACSRFRRRPVVGAEGKVPARRSVQRGRVQSQAVDSAVDLGAQTGGGGAGGRGDWVSRGGVCPGAEGIRKRRGRGKKLPRHNAVCNSSFERLETGGTLPPAFDFQLRPVGHQHGPGSGLITTTVQGHSF